MMTSCSPRRWRGPKQAVVVAMLFRFLDEVEARYCRVLVRHHPHRPRVRSAAYIANSPASLFVSEQKGQGPASRRGGWSRNSLGPRLPLTIEDDPFPGQRILAVLGIAAESSLAVANGRGGYRQFIGRRHLRQAAAYFVVIGFRKIGSGRHHAPKTGTSCRSRRSSSPRNVQVKAAPLQSAV